MTCCFLSCSVWCFWELQVQSNRHLDEAKIYLEQRISYSVGTEGMMNFWHIFYNLSTVSPFPQLVLFFFQGAWGQLINFCSLRWVPDDCSLLISSFLDKNKYTFEGIEHIFVDRLFSFHDSGVIFQIFFKFLNFKVELIDTFKIRFVFSRNLMISLSFMFHFWLMFWEDEWLFLKSSLQSSSSIG